MPDISSIRYKIIGEIPSGQVNRVLLDTLIEECAECIQAASKLKRAMGLTKSPTPYTPERALRELTEEIADVANAIHLWDSRYPYGDKIKLERMHYRLKEAYNPDAAESDCE